MLIGIKMNVGKKIVLGIKLLLLSFFIYLIASIYGFLGFDSCCRGFSLCGDPDNFYYRSLSYSSNLATLREMDKNFKLDKNICYTFNNYYMLKETEYLDHSGINCTLLLYESKLIKEGKKCFVYRLRLKDVMTEEKYNVLINKGQASKQIVGNYDSGKKCGKGDYENCNMYITEKGILKYDNDYKCE